MAEQPPSSPVEGLPDGAVVIRGGALDRRRARLNALAVHRDTGFYGLCVASRADMSAAEMAKKWNYVGDWYVESSVGAIRSLGEGFDVVEDQEEGPVQSLLVLPHEPREDFDADPQWAALDSAFPGPPQQNPNSQRAG